MWIEMCHGMWGPRNIEPWTIVTTCHICTHNAPCPGLMHWDYCIILYRGLSERQFLHSSTGESNTSCWVFHKQMVESFQTLAQYWKPIQNLGTKIWHHLKNNILSMVMLKLWANLSPSYVKSWLNVKLFIISCCLAVQEVLCSPAVEGHKPG